MSVGRFAERARLSLKALRLYDAVGPHWAERPSLQHRLAVQGLTSWRELPARCANHSPFTEPGA